MCHMGYFMVPVMFLIAAEQHMSNAHMLVELYIQYKIQTQPKLKTL